MADKSILSAFIKLEKEKLERERAHKMRALAKLNEELAQLGKQLEQSKRPKCGASVVIIENGEVEVRCLNAHVLYPPQVH